MKYKFDKPRPGESLKDYLIRHRAHPLHTPPEERFRASDEELLADGALLPEDDPVYTEGLGIGIGIAVCIAIPMRHIHYYLIGPGPGTNLIKEEDGLVYALDDNDEWRFSPYAITYLYGDVDTEGPLTEDEARKAFERISGGKRWVP